MAKNREQKQNLVAFYTEIVNNQDFVVLSLNKVPAKILTTMRMQLTAHQAGLYVIKNTLFVRALKESDHAVEWDLHGNNLLLTAGSDITASLKVIEDGRQKVKDILLLKVESPEELKDFVAYTHKKALIQGQSLEADKIQRLISLPSREALLGQFVGLLNAPLSGLMNVLTGNIRQLTLALNGLQQKKAEAKS